MEKELIDFINENEQLVNENRWEELYQKCETNLRGKLTDCLLSAELDVFEDMNKIPDYAFSGSTVKEFNIPNSVTSIGWYAFHGCSSLESIKIPSSITSISIHAFGRCERLTSIVIPDSVTEIGKWAFYGCDSLGTIILPRSITSIDEGAFTLCGDIEIRFDGTKEDWKKIYNSKAFENTYFTIYCTNGKITRRKK